MDDHSHHSGDTNPSHGVNRGYAPEGHAVPGGLALAANGLRFAPSKTRFDPGTPTDWTFEIISDDGQVVRNFDDAHGQRSHLIVVRRDLTRFQHLHPELDSDGTWHVEGFTLPDPGVYRAFVDIVVEGQPTTLGFDLFTSKTGGVAARLTSSRQATADGYDIKLVTSEASARERTQLVFEVQRDGEPVSELGEYLGAHGHLVALREGDLAYLHVHPEETAADSGRVEFGAQFPTPGRYRLFLQAKPDGHLITTQFDVRIGDSDDIGPTSTDVP